MASSDEWWRHDNQESSSSSRRSSGASSNTNRGSAGAGASQSQNNASSGSGQAASNSSPYANSYSRYTAQDHYSLSGDTVAPWRQKDATSHLNAMRSKRDSRVRGRSGTSSYSSAARSGAARSGAAPSRDSQGRRIDSHVPRTQYSQFKDEGGSVPQFKDMTARHGGWNIPSLGTKSNTGTSSSIFGTGRGFDTRKLIMIAAGVLGLILVVLILRGLVGCVGSVFASAPEETAATEEAAATAAVTNSSGTTSGVAYTVLDENRTTASGMGRVSFSAVGDNLMNENLLELADSWAGESGDGEYDFSPFYTDVSAYIKNWIDVSFINQETTLGGTDNFNYAGYPSYNTPDSLADAVANAGWRMVNLNSNHTYDTWTASIEHNQSVWAQKTSLVTVGSYTSEEDRATIRTVECNGIRIAMLSYCYGQNGYEQSDLPNDYYAVPWDEERMKSEVANARTVADVVIVYMHAGTEYTNEPNDQEKEIAQACADNGVDLVIGSHAHVIQPVEWIERADGSGKMLCAYGLGDFVAGYTSYPDTIMSGMLTLDFVRIDSSDSETGDAASEDAVSDEATTEESASTESLNVGPGGIAIENVVWHPLIEHMEGNTDKVRFVSGYSDEEARNNELLAELDDPYTWIVEKTKEVIGSEITIDM